MTRNSELNETKFVISILKGLIKATIPTTRVRFMIILVNRSPKLSVLFLRLTNSSSYINSGIAPSGARSIVVIKNIEIPVVWLNLAVMYTIASDAIKILKKERRNMIT